jgi:hypothetical protein
MVQGANSRPDIYTDSAGFNYTPYRTNRQLIREGGGEFAGPGTMNTPCRFIVSNTARVGCTLKLSIQLT